VEFGNLSSSPPLGDANTTGACIKNSIFLRSCLLLSRFHLLSAALVNTMIEWSEGAERANAKLNTTADIAARAAAEINLRETSLAIAAS